MFKVKVVESGLQESSEEDRVQFDVGVLTACVEQILVENSLENTFSQLLAIMNLRS